MIFIPYYGHQVTWLVTEAQVSPGNAKKYAPRLIAAGVASAERLAKKLAREEQFLLQVSGDTRPDPTLHTFLPTMSRLCPYLILLCVCCAVGGGRGRLR